ncbi:transposase [Dietzia cinnamea]|uniref:transposase n=1 Tax=Dietzia cinnamea TaxID=321318 RepID=UPI0035CD34E2
MVRSFTIDVSRDRAGTFTPRPIRRGQHRLDGLGDMIFSLYAGRMTTREIEHHLATTIGVELSAGMVSASTEAVRRRPGLAELAAGGVLPAVDLDAIRVEVHQDHHVVGTRPTKLSGSPSRVSIMLWGSGSRTPRAPRPFVIDDQLCQPKTRA